MEAVTPVTEPVQPAIQSPIHSLAWNHTQNQPSYDDEKIYVEEDTKLSESDQTDTKMEKVTKDNGFLIL
jgi:hypothetical protein